MSSKSPGLEQRFPVDAATAAQDLNIIVELGQADPEKPVEHYFRIRVDCAGCGGTLMKTSFATYPTGGAGRYIFLLEKGQIKIPAQARGVTLGIALTMQIADAAVPLSVPVAICLAAARTIAAPAKTTGCH